MTTEDIQDEIERTRGQMANTLHAIEAKLSPRNLLDQAVDTMRELAQDQSPIRTAVRDNPLPLALIGLGIGWLAFSGVRRVRGASDTEAMEELPYEGAESSWVPAGPARAGGTDYTYAAGMASSGYESESETMESSRERAAALTRQAGERLSDTSQRARRRMADWSRGARASAGQAASRTRDAYQEHPLTMGVAAALLGMALGALLPRSRPETEALGETGRRAMRQMRAAGEDLRERAGQVAERAVGTLKEEGREALRRVGESAEEEARRQGLASEGTPAPTPRGTMH